MKAKTIISILMACQLVYNSPVLAQRGKHKSPGHHIHPNARKTVRVYKYPRNKVVVVKHRRIHTVSVLPVGHTTIVFKGNKYFHHNGLFYSLAGSHYAVVIPPIGLRVKLLPPGYKKVIIAGNPHFYCMGVYYKQVNDEYETVEPEAGTIVSELPENNVEKITIDGQPYYELDGMLYKSIDGKQYEMVGKLDA